MGLDHLVDRRGCWVFQHCSSSATCLCPPTFSSQRSRRLSVRVSGLPLTDGAQAYGPYLCVISCTGPLVNDEISTFQKQRVTFQQRKIHTEIHADNSKGQSECKHRHPKTSSDGSHRGCGPRGTSPGARAAPADEESGFPEGVTAARHCIGHDRQRLLGAGLHTLSRRREQLNREK